MLTYTFDLTFDFCLDLVIVTIVVSISKTISYWESESAISHLSTATNNFKTLVEQYILLISWNYRLYWWELRTILS